MSLILTFSACLYAQNGAIDTPDAGYENTFITFAGLIAGVAFFTEAIKKLIPSMHGIATQIVSWTIGVLIAYLGWQFSLGMFADMLWYVALLYGLGASLVANGVADTGLMYWVFDLFRRK